MVLWTPKHGKRKQGRQALTYIHVLTNDAVTVIAFGLEFFSSLDFGFPGALHLQSTV